MKVFAAATVSESTDHALFVSLSRGGLIEQILEMGRAEYGDDPNDNNVWDAEEYANYDGYLLAQYEIHEGEFDL